ncbi:MAG TPA: RES domain-containing protein [Longimicrobium sp.]|nr:RES domain-containing protein [Longimicrobium sp.]
MIPANELPACLAGLPRIAVAGVFWRTVAMRHVRGAPPGAPAGSPPRPLWPGGPVLRGARYTRAGGCNALYLAPDAAAALAEVEAVLFGDDGTITPGPAHDPLAVFAATVDLPAVVDLCDAEVQRALRTSYAELTAPWLRAQERHRLGRGDLPPTQALGEAACAAGSILALRYPSYRRPGVKNLVVFTGHLAALNGRVDLVDESGGFLDRLP